MENNPVLIFNNVLWNDKKYKQLYASLDVLHIPYVMIADIGGDYKAPVIIAHGDGLVNALIYCQENNYIPKVIFAIYPESYASAKYAKELEEFNPDDLLAIKHNNLVRIKKDPNFKNYNIFRIRPAYYNEENKDVITYKMTTIMHGLYSEKPSFGAASFHHVFNLAISVAYNASL